MKKTALFLTAFLLSSTAAIGGLAVTGEGKDRRFDPSAFSPDMQEKYALMEAKCAGSCHGMGRTVEAIDSGIAPISKSPFDKTAAKKYGVKMMRMPNSGIDKKQAKSLVQLMYFLIDESGR